MFAEGATRPEAASRRDWLRRDGRQDRHGRDRGGVSFREWARALWQGWGGSASGGADEGGAYCYRPESSCKALGLMPHPSPAIANEFLKKPGALGTLTQMQLQKLAYIAHGWNLAVNKEPLVSDPVEAWDYGPVFPKLYDHAKYFGSSPISRLITDADDDRLSFFLGLKSDSGEPYNATLTPSERDVIDRVWQRYSKYNAFKLSDLTHKVGTPWYKTYFERGKNHTIPNELIREHYVELAKSVAPAD